MSQPIIRVKNLGKKYTIRHEHPERYTALRDVLAQKAKKLFSFPKHLRPATPVSEYEDFWALKDINFEVQQGDRVGIIGRNGAGKSTLLKILSRITEPTTGRIELNGRVASLLEVGTGFHPELTGRENIFLNGAILGMNRAEIKSKFDEIVDFSGVEKFLDTPVKRYSSGMYVRLAFAVAAHLDPEILVVDEVLAVGDVEFQKKCLGKMETVSQEEGRTVLFVSHNMETIEALCKQGIYLDKGMLISSGTTQKIISQYFNNINNIKNKSRNEVKITDELTLKYLRISNETYCTFADINFEIHLESKIKSNYSSIALFIYDSFNRKQCFLDLRSSELFSFSKTNPNLRIEGVFENPPLLPGLYSIGMHIQSNICYQDIYDLIHFEVLERISETIAYENSVRGFFNPKISFNYV